MKIENMDIYNNLFIIKTRLVSKRLVKLINAKNTNVDKAIYVNVSLAILIAIIITPYEIQIIGL